MQKPPNSFELINTIRILQKLRDYISDADLNGIYDLYLLDGATNTVEHFMETENDNKVTPKTKSTTKETTTPTNTNFSHSDYDYID